MQSNAFRLVVLTTIAFIVHTAIVARSQSSSWTPNGSMPFERGEIAVAAVNGKIYVISGSSRGVEANAFNQEFDPASGMWRERALMPSVASHAGAAVLNGKIYVVGGFVANVHVGAVNRVFEYDPAADRWRALAPLGAPRGSPGVVALNGKIHAIGGRDPERNTVATHEVYDPATNSWSMAAPLPLARDHLGIAIAGGRIHVFGGRTNATVDNTARHDVYDPATNSWSTAAPLITPRSAGVAVFLGEPDPLRGRRMQGSAGKRHVHRGGSVRSANRPVDSFAATAAREARRRGCRRGTAGLSLWRQHGLRRQQAVERGADFPHAVNRTAIRLRTKLLYPLSGAVWRSWACGARQGDTVNQPRAFSAGYQEHALGWLCTGGTLRSTIRPPRRAVFARL